MQSPDRASCESATRSPIYSRHLSQSAILEPTMQPSSPTIIFRLLAGACIRCVTTTGATAASLDTIYKTISNARFVDLTHSFGTDTPVWAGFGQAKMTPAVGPTTKRPYTIPSDGFRTTFYEMVGQYGTHILTSMRPRWTRTRSSR